MAAKFLIIGMFVMLVGSKLAVGAANVTCPPCKSYTNNLCHRLIMEKDGKGCSCRTCVGVCSESQDLCPLGSECAYGPLNCTFPPCPQTAMCVPFTKCPELKCNVTCKYGYRQDINGCTRCYCRNPCAEMNCSSGCDVELLPGLDPDYSCSTLDQGQCPNCEVFNKFTCMELRKEKKGGCLCDACTTRCLNSFNLCPKGFQCVEGDIGLNFYPFIQKSAICVPFTKCPKYLKCSLKCPMSGYAVDLNGCRKCMCNNPCAELKCRVPCRKTSILGQEERYNCPERKFGWFSYR